METKERDAVLSQDRDTCVGLQRQKVVDFTPRLYTAT